MISFNCPRCTKAFIVPDRAASSQKTCTACGENLWVPAVQRTARRRRPWLLPAVVLLALASGALGWWWHSGNREDTLVQKHFAERIRTSSNRWQGIDWQRCDPQIGDYRVQLYFGADQGAYVFVLTRGAGSAMTFVRVNARANARDYLALASFSDQQAETFKYSGHNDAEKADLDRLAKDLVEALDWATP
jgi:hypothetical protein